MPHTNLMVRVARECLSNPHSRQPATLASARQRPHANGLWSLEEEEVTTREAILEALESAD